MASNNQAAWLDGANQKLRVAEASSPKAAPGTVVVKNKFIAVNPVDWKIQDYGVFIKTWPTILGTDVAGEVVEVGEDVKRFKKGDRVIAHTINLISGDEKDGGFQLYTSVQEGKTAILPDSIGFDEGSVLPLAFDTAAVGLYSPTSEGFLGLPFPSANPSSSNKTIVVWGGSGSVGCLAIQLAAASGVKVVTTASSHNFDFCKKLGATEVFDYKSSSVVDDVVHAVQSAGGDFVGVYDSISENGKSYDYVLPILERLGGGSLAVVLGPPESPPSNVKVGGIFGVSELTHPLWRDFLTQALESGQIRCLPEPLVVGKGLDSVQKGLDENKKGVSAKKVVIEL